MLAVLFFIMAAMFMPVSVRAWKSGRLELGAFCLGMAISLLARSAYLGGLL